MKTISVFLPSLTRFHVQLCIYLKYSENANELLFSNLDSFVLHLSNLAAHSMQNNNFLTEIPLVEEIAKLNKVNKPTKCKRA